jgi:hypothetical protein
MLLVSEDSLAVLVLSSESGGDEVRGAANEWLVFEGKKQAQSDLNDRCFNLQV